MQETPPQAADAPSIAEMLDQLGPARNYAEQCVIDRMRADLELERRAASAATAMYHWAAAHTRYVTIWTFRDWAKMPVQAQQLATVTAPLGAARVED